MNEDLIGLTVMFSALALVLPLAFLHASFKAQEVEEAWRKLSLRHRLDFKPGRLGRGLEVTGSLAGRPFRLKKEGGGNKVAFHMELGLRGSLPAGLRMRPGKRRLTAPSNVSGVPESQVIERTGEVRIDDEMSVTASDPRQIAEYLTAARKRAAVQLAGVGAELDGHQLRVTVTKQADDLEGLDRAVHVLAASARALDGA